MGQCHNWCMPTVTRLARPEKGANRARRVIVEFDGEPWAECDETLVAEFRLYRGCELDEAAFEHLGERLAETELMQRAVVIATRRALTRHELAERLKGGGAPEPLVELTVAECERQGLVNDRRYAEAFTGARSRRGHGPRRIRRDLAMRGIDREIIDELESDGGDRDGQIEVCRELAARRLRDRSLDDPAERARIERFLAGRGFDHGVIRAAVDQLRSGCT